MAFIFPSDADLIIGKICLGASVSATESETENASVAGSALHQVCTGTVTNAKESLETPRKEKGERETTFCNTFSGARKFWGKSSKFHFKPSALDKERLNYRYSDSKKLRGWTVIPSL